MPDEPVPDEPTAGDVDDAGHAVPDEPSAARVPGVGVRGVGVRGDADQADGASGPSGPSGGASSLLRSSAVVAVGTTASRVTGLVRTIAERAALGGVASAGLAGSFSIANVAPNILYDLLAGGVLAATIVPAFVDARRSHDRTATEAVLSVLGVALVGLTAAAMLAAPVLVRFFALPPEEERLTLFFLLLLLPQIFFYGLSTLLSGLLNAYGRFAAAALAPVVTNVLTVIVLLVFVARVGQPSAALLDTDTSSLWLLALGTTGGIAAMGAVLLPASRNLGLGLRWRFDLRHPAVRRVTRLSGWTFGYVAVNQAAFLVIIRLATDRGSIQATYYQTAYQFFQLPYGILAAAIFTAFLPALTDRVKAADAAGFGEQFLLGLRSTLLVVLPATVILVLLAEPIVAVLLGHGNNGAADVSATAGYLSAFAIGLPGYCLYLLAMRGFYAHSNTRLPFFVNLGQTAVQLGLCLLFLDLLGPTGLALGFTLAFSVGAGAALFWLDRHVGGLPWSASLASAGRLLAATAAMAVVTALVARTIGSEQGTGALLRLVLAGGLGTAAFLGAAVALGAPELARVVGPLRARLGR